MSGTEAAPGAEGGGGHAAAPARSRGLRRLLGRAALLVVLAFVAVAVWRDRTAIGAGLARLDPAVVAVALGAVLTGLVANALSWRAVLSGLGSPLPVSTAGRVYLLAQLGKYLPGSLWPVLAQTELGREHGVPRARSAVAALVALVVGLVMGIVVAVACLAVASPAVAADHWWLALAAVLGVGVLLPPVLRPVLALVSRVAGARSVDVDLDVPGLGPLCVAAAWSLAMWVAFGVQAAVLADGLGADQPRLWLLCTGAYAVAWVSGFLVVVVPAGAGAREAVLVLVLAPALGRSDALTLALVSRVLMLVGDLAVGAAAAVAHHLRERRPASRAGSRSLRWPGRRPPSSR